MDFNTAVTTPAGTAPEEFATMITSEIMTKCEKNLIYKITESEFPYTPRSDIQQIYSIAIKNAGPDSDDIMAVMNYNRRKALVEESALSYLRENNFIILNGFINFRLGEYKNELKKLCHSAMEEFSARREYDEFLNMLRFFVPVQAPKENLVHLVKKNDMIRIQNRMHRDITDDYANEFSFTDEQFTHEDIALSALITISPVRIIIHDKKENDKIYETIDAVFSDVEFR